MYMYVYMRVYARVCTCQSRILKNNVVEEVFGVGVSQSQN